MAPGKTFPFCSQGLETQGVSLFSHALRANRHVCLLLQLGDTQPGREDQLGEISGEKQGKGKR